MSTERGAQLAFLAGWTLLGSVAIEAAIPPGGEPQEPQAERPVLGTRSTLKIEREERVALPAGTQLHGSPSEWSSVLARLETEQELTVVERRPGWLLVRYEDLRAWASYGEVGVSGASAENDISGHDIAEEEIPEELWLQMVPRSQRLSRAAELLRSPPERTLGPYLLLTDLDPRRERETRLLERLDRLAGEVERAFRERYGLPVVTPPERQVVVLFRRKRLYNDFVAPEGAIATAPSVGHASPGMMVLASEGLDGDELAAIFIHELVHLLNQRAFLREVPPWLEEGIAEDLGLARVSKAGMIDVGTLRGSSTLRSGRTRDQQGQEVLFQELVVRGPRLVLARVIERWASGGPDLVALLESPWREFALGAEWDLNYVESAFLMRYLLDAQEERFRGKTRQFLRTVRLGGPSDAPALARHLDVEIEELERGFEAWVGFQAVESQP